jgi:hypothetical protein
MVIYEVLRPNPGGSVHPCSVCREQTILLVGGVPLCPKCDDEREKRREAEIRKRWETQLQSPDSGRSDPGSSAEA